MKKAIIVLVVVLAVAAAALGVYWYSAQGDASTVQVIEPKDVSKEYVVNNITVAYDGTEVKLNPEIRFTAGKEGEKAAAHFELGLQNKALLPMSGEITEDGVKFGLGDSGRAYTISKDTLTEYMEMDFEGMAALQAMEAYWQSYAALMNRSMHDEKFTKEYNDKALKILIETCGEKPVKEKVEIEGKTYNAKKVHLNLTAENTMALMDKMASCGIAEVENMMKALLDMMNTTDGSQYASYGEMSTEIEDLPLPVDMIYFSKGKMNYQKIAMDTELEGIPMAVEVVSLMNKEGTDYSMVMRAGDDEFLMEMSMEAEITGPITAPEAFSADFGMHVAGNYSLDEEFDEGMMTYSSTYVNNIGMSVDGKVENGLTQAEGSFLTEVAVSDTYGEEVEEYAYDFSMEYSYGETAEEDGSITSSVDLNMEDDGVPLDISFDVNSREIAYPDYFTGSEEHVLTLADDDPALEMIEEDASGFGVDAMALMFDVSIMQLLGLGGGVLGGLMGY